MKNTLDLNFILCGSMCAGKDEVGAKIQGIRLAFGDNIRTIVKSLRTGYFQQAHLLMTQYFDDKPPIDLAQQLMDFSKIPKDPPKDRPITQALGTWARSIKDDIWINSVRQQIKPENNYVICDCRRLSELEEFVDFISIYVDASPEVRKQRLIARDGSFDPAWEQHEAEQEVKLLQSKCDFTITNNGSLKELENEIYGLMCYLGRKA